MVEPAPHSERLLKIERRVRHNHAMTTITLLVAAAVGLGGWTRAPQESDVIRARAVIIEDAQGRERVMLGAPVPGRRQAPAAGMVIVDTAGVERFGLTLRGNGSMGMGFDAPPGTGDDRNRERINIVATSTGGAHIRFLNRQTWVVGYLQLGNDDRLYLDFLQYSPDSVVQRRIGIVGDETTRRARYTR